MEPFIADPDFVLYLGDVREVLAAMPAGSVDCCVTSPPYWGLRNYGHVGQIGLEDTPEAYIAEMVAVFAQVRRTLTDTGTCWLNLGDSYVSVGSGTQGEDGQMATRRVAQVRDQKAVHGEVLRPPSVGGLAAKNLVGIPWRVALALQADGWYLRSDIIWAKPNPMPESVTDRPTKSHEYVFLLTKQPRYFFDADAVRGNKERKPNPAAALGHGDTSRGIPWTEGVGRNIRSVWDIATHPYAEAHFATFPEALPERCIKAGCPEQVCATCGKARERLTEVTRGGTSDRDGSRFVGAAGPRGTNFTGKAYGSDTRGAPSRTAETVGWSDCGHGNYRPGRVLDPFMGSGTTALVARRLGRKSVGIELNPEYAALCARRLQQLSLLAEEPAA